jgi:UDPglucose 6-dehydrogenase
MNPRSSSSARQCRREQLIGSPPRPASGSCSARVRPWRDAGPPFPAPRDIDWAILGGPRDTTGEVARLYMRVFSSALRIAHTDARTAELTKYMENAFLAMKVAFCNEFFDIAGAMGVDYDDLRELWLMDPRIGRSHTWVHRGDRGFGGRCLPKDLAAIIAAARDAGHPPTILEAVRDANTALRASPGTGG